MQRCFLFAPLCGAQAITALGARGVIAQAWQEWEARAALRERRRPGPMRRPTGAAGALLAPMQSPPGGFAQSLGGNLQPAQSERNFRKLFRHEVLEMRRI